MIFDGWIMPPPRLRFDPALPARTSEKAFQGLRLHGPYDASRIALGQASILFVFPESHRSDARKLLNALRGGIGSYPGFEAMFGVALANDRIQYLAMNVDVSSPAKAAAGYRTEIGNWAQRHRKFDPQLALVLVPHSDSWETDRPYYEAKASLARLGIPTQMVTTELLGNDREFGWSIANIALASFAKLGGVPWVVDAPNSDQDLVVGVGRADIRKDDGTVRIFGYALSFVANGEYRHAWSFVPAADESSYVARFEEALTAGLAADRGQDRPFSRVVVHLAKRTGRDEIAAVRHAMASAGVSVPVAFLRLDDQTLFDLADGRHDTLDANKGLAVRLGPRRILVQTDSAGPLGPPDGPLLVELDQRSDVGADELEELAAQAFRLAHANWRGFNARSSPVTLAYGRLLAKLVGYLEDVDTWDPSLLRSDLTTRPWFL